MEDTTIEQKYKKWIVFLSVAIPLAVVALFGIRLKSFGVNPMPLTFLPPIYATINGLTAILLFSAVSAVKNGNRKLHETLMKIAIGCSLLFLLMYIAYHMTTDETVFGDLNHDGIRDAVEKAKVGWILFLYWFILATHIILSIVIIPMVLISYVRGIAGNYERHKKISRITYPLWLYVAVTGVVVYLMISPYYA
jgi:putative membrane protein